MLRFACRQSLRMDLSDICDEWQAVDWVEKKAKWAEPAGETLGDSVIRPRDALSQIINNYSRAGSPWCFPECRCSQEDHHQWGCFLQAKAGPKEEFCCELTAVYTAHTEYKSCVINFFNYMSMCVCVCLCVSTWVWVFKGARRGH